MKNRVKFGKIRTKKNLDEWIKRIDPLRLHLSQTVSETLLELANGERAWGALIREKDFLHQNYKKKDFNANKRFQLELPTQLATSEFPRNGSDPEPARINSDQYVA